MVIASYKHYAYELRAFPKSDRLCWEVVESLLYGELHQYLMKFYKKKVSGGTADAIVFAATLL